MAESLSITFINSESIKIKIAELSDQINSSEKNLLQLANSFNSAKNSLDKAKVDVLLNEATALQVESLTKEVNGISSQIVKEEEKISACKKAIEILKGRLVEVEANERSAQIKQLQNLTQESITKHLDSIHTVLNLAELIEKNDFEIKRLKDYGKFTSGVMIAVEGEKRDRILSSIKTLKELFHLQ